MKCPNGHDSTELDYCDVCGAAMPSDAAATDAAANDAGGDVSEGAADPTGEGGAGGGPAGSHDRPCPSCGQPSIADALFCEGCGYDFTTGTMPRAATSSLDLDAPATPPGDAASPAGDTPAAAGPSAPAPGATAADATAADGAATDKTAPELPGSWVAEVWIDPAWYRDQGSPDPMPSPGPPTIFALTRSSLLIGRESQSRGIEPDVNCGVDNGVSRRHAQLTSDGSRWWVEDLDSANGTWVGDTVGKLPSTPIPSRAKREISDDDRIYVGSWTRIVVRRADPDEVAALTP